MVYAQPRIRPMKWDAQNSLEFWDTNKSSNLRQTTRSSDCQQKKRSYRIVDFAVPADHRVKLKESKKRNKYLDLAWELKKLWHMKVTVIPIVIGAFGTVTKGLVQELEGLETRGREETIQTNYSIVATEQNTKKSPRDLRRLAVSQTPLKNSQMIIVYSFRVFHTSVSWWFLTGVWVTASLLKSPGLVSGFWPFLAMPSFG